MAQAARLNREKSARREFWKISRKSSHCIGCTRQQLLSGHMKVQNTRQFQSNSKPYRHLDFMFMIELCQPRCMFMLCGRSGAWQWNEKVLSQGGCVWVLSEESVSIYMWKLRCSGRYGCWVISAKATPDAAATVVEVLRIWMDLSPSWTMESSHWITRIIKILLSKVCFPDLFFRLHSFLEESKFV